MNDDELIEEIADITADGIVSFNVHRERAKEIITLIDKHRHQQCRNAVGGKRVYAPQGANFDQQRQCEQINLGITFAQKAIDEVFKPSDQPASSDE